MARPLTTEEEAALRKHFNVPANESVDSYTGLLDDNAIKYIVGTSGVAKPVTPKPTTPKTPARPTLQTQPPATPAPVTTPTVAVSTPSAPKVRTTVEAKKLEAGLPIVVQPETGMLPRRNQTSGREIVEKAETAKKAEIEGLAAGPLSVRLSPEAERMLKERTERLATEGRTASGERRPLTPKPTTFTDIFGTGIVGRTLEAVAPQTIVAPSQVEGVRARSDQAYKDAQRFMQDNPNLFPSLSNPEAESERFRKVYEGYYYEGKAPKLLGSRPLARAAEKVATTTLPTGQVIESPITTLGKIVSVPEAALVAGAKTAGEKAAALTAERPVETVPMSEKFYKEAKGGGGLMTGTQEAFQEMGRQAGLDKDTQEFLGYVGGALGVGTGLLIPLDLGVSSAFAGGVKGGTGAAAVAKEFGATGGEALAAGVRGAGRGALEGAWDAYRIFTPKTGGKIAVSNELKSATSRFLSSPRLDDVSNITLRLAANENVQAAIAADRALGQASVDTSIAASSRPVYDPQILKDAIRTEYEALTGRFDFDEYVRAAEGYGVDFTNTAGRRAVEAGTPPVNVRAKEPTEALRKTSVGVDTTHYFDELATGGRSDLYFNALIDSLDDAVKADLVAGKAIKSTDLEPAIDAFINNIRMSDVTTGGALTKSVAAALESELKARGINITQARILGQRAKTATGQLIPPTGKGAFILPTSVEGFDAIKNAFKVDTAKRFVNNFTSKTGIVGRQVKLGDLTLSVEDAKSTLENVKKKAPVLTDIRKSFNPKTGLMTVTESQLQALRKYFTEPFQTTIMGKGGVIDRSGRTNIYGVAAGTGLERNIAEAVGETAPVPSLKPTDVYSPYQTNTVLTRIETLLDSSGTAVISADQFNDLVKGAIAIEASPKVTAKTKTDLGVIASRLAGEGKNAELSYFAREVFKPKDFSESGIAEIFVDTSKKFTEPANKNPVVTEIVNEVNARMGSLSETFKRKMRVQMGETQVGIGKTGVSRPEAFANVLVEEFTEGPVYRPTVLETPEKTVRQRAGGLKTTNLEDVSARVGGAEVTRGQPRTQAEIMEARAAGAYEMFRTNVAAMFGGYERAIDSISTTGRITDLDAQAVSTVEMRNLVTVLMETPAFKPYLDAFETAIMKGDNVGAINSLQRMHIDFYGYSIEQILTRKGNIAVRDIDSVIGGATDVARTRAGSDVFLYRGRVNPNIRSIDETFRSASQQAMVIKPENFSELVTGTYFTKAQANILDEVLLAAQQKHPDLFPSAAVLQDVAFDDFQVVKNGVVSQLEEIAAKMEATGETEAIVQAGMIRDTLIPWMVERGVITPRANTTFIQDLLIDGVGDYVQSISSTTGKGSKYFNTLIGKETGDLLALAGNVKDANFFTSVMRRALEDSGVEPASIYKQTFGTNARADATALFYQTALTDIKNNLKNPLAGSLQGVAEKAATIPLLTKTSAGIKRPVFTATNLKSITETMEGISLATTSNKLDQVVAANGEVVAREVERIERSINSNLTEMITAEEKALASVKEKLIAGKPLYVTSDIGASYEYYRKLSTEAMLDGLSDIYPTMNGIAKNGLLGGHMLPNMNYLMTNLLTGPSIVASTVGMGQAAKLPLVIPEVSSVMKWVYAPAWAKTDKILVTAADGTIYTSSSIGKIVAEGGIGRSQASAELTNQLIQSAIDWAGKTGLYGDKAAVTKAIQRNFINWNDMNVWSTLANSVDQWYRTSVLINGLKSGEQLPQALKLARESLFDYGNLSQFEKDVVSKVFWFWTFRRNNWRSVYTSILTDPRRLKVAFAQQQGWSYIYNMGEKTFGTPKEDMDYRYAMKEYSESRMFLTMMEDPENKKRTAVLGPAAPQLQTYGDMIDYLSIPVAIAASYSGVSGEPYGFTQGGYDLLDLVVQQSNPYVQGLAAATIGVDLRTGKATGTYLDPKLMWYVRSNEQVAEAFNTLVQVEAVPYDEENPSVGYYQGRQWRIVKDDKQSQKNWAMIKSLMLGVGVGRTVQDYAPILQSFKPVQGYEPDPTMQNSFWKGMGVVTYQDAPLIEEIQRSNRQAAAREIKEISPIEVPAAQRYAKE